MRTIECTRESDVIDAVTTGRWDAELQAHVAGCALCGDLAEVTRTLQHEHAQALQEARVPASGLVWWRMELRARHEAARAAARPIAMAQAIAAACGLVLAFALLAAALPWIERWLGMPAGVTALVREGALASISATTLQWIVPLALAFIAWLVIAPLAIYLVLSDE